MAPILYPPKGRQTFMVKGEGNFKLTDNQRRARSLVMTVEKVKTGFVYDYFNFSTPEPNTHWGYIQLMAQDFVIETQQLEYRRQVVKHWDVIELDPIEQLRCLVRNTADLMYGLGLELLPTELPDNAEETIRYELWKESVRHPRIIPQQLMTSVWYKIDVGRSAFVTIDWEGYAITECDFPTPTIAPGASPPKKGESDEPGSPGNSGGGGSRNPAGPPQNQQGDNSSDSSGPTQGSSVPPSPGEGRNFGGGGVGGQTKVTWGGGSFYNDQGCAQQQIGPIIDYLPGDIDPATITTGASAGSPRTDFCAGDGIDRSVYLVVGGAQYGRSYGNAKFTSLPSIISVEYIP